MASFLLHWHIQILTHKTLESWQCFLCRLPICLCVYFTQRSASPYTVRSKFSSVNTKIACFCLATLSGFELNTLRRLHSRDVWAKRAIKSAAFVDKMELMVLVPLTDYIGPSVLILPVPFGCCLQLNQSILKMKVCPRHCIKFVPFSPRRSTLQHNRVSKVTRDPIFDFQFLAFAG